MISLVLTIKNEEQFLPSCLENLRPLASEIVVVDTGSTDSSKAIALAAGCRVFDFKWHDNFADARNFSISKAKYDWILWMDPDERIDPFHFAAIRNLTKRDELAYMITSRNYTHRRASEAWQHCQGDFPQWEKSIEGYWEAHSIKLFRNREDIKFEGRVHETVKYALPKDYIVPSPQDIIIHHYGNLEEVVEDRKKKNFYLNLAKQESVESPNYGFAQFCVGRDAAERGDFKTAAEAFEIATRYESDRADIVNNLGFAQMQLEEFNKADASFDKCLTMDPEFSEAWLNRGVLRMQVRKLDDALFMLNRALEIYPGFVPAWRARGQCLAKIGRFDDAEVAFRRAISLRPEVIDSKVDLAMMRLQTNQFEKGIEILEEALQQEPNEPRAESLYIQYISEYL